MYSGIVEMTGKIEANERFESGCRLQISTNTENISPEDSVAISGVCLTAESVTEGLFEAFLSEETVSRTYLSQLEPGDQVNIEHPLPADGRFDGHVVKGTVDTVTVITNIEDYGNDWEFTFSPPRGYEQYLVEKGAVALDGISVTITEVTGDAFSIAVVPTTYDLTTLSEKSVGDYVHFEADILAKYVERQRKVET